MSVIRRIFIPPDVTADHRTVVQRYVERIGELSGSEWPLVIEAFNLLRHAVISSPYGVLSILVAVIL